VFWVISVYFNLRNILPKSGTFPPGHLYIMQRVNVGRMGEFRLKLAIVCGGMLLIHLQVMAAPKSLKKSAMCTLRCTVLASICFNITTTVVLTTNNRSYSIRSLMEHLACTVITLALYFAKLMSIHGAG
jgi:hypothetical protein